MAPPSELQEFVRLYNNRYFFEAHEVLEEAWLNNRSTLYHGLIILAAAFCKRDCGNPNGIVRNLVKARQHLQRAVEAGSNVGLDVTSLLTQIDRRLDSLRGAGVDPERFSTRDGDADPGKLRQLAPDLPLALDVN